jgi:16S rRNA (cytosine967-C5)-methyltransferase
MDDSKLSPRTAAWLILNKFDPKLQNAGKLIDEFSRKTNNRSAVVEIALGVIRNLIFIDNFIGLCSGRTIKNIQPKILNCLRTAVYELVFTNQAQYAIVNEAVELSKKSISKKSAGFTNAILRKVVGAIKNKEAELEKCDSNKTLPITEKTGCEFNIDILPDENKDKAEYLSGAFSLPKWFLEELINQFGYQQAKSICFGSNRRPSVYARPNLLKVKAVELVNILRSQEVDCELVENDNLVKLNKTGNIAELESFKSGLFTIQDLTASSVVTILQPQSGWTVFDICAAPGTKTTQIAEMMGDKGIIVATDKDITRLKKINENVQRLGITSVKILSYVDFLKEAENNNKADAILLDVPCSNTGVLAKRPEVRFRLNKKQIEDITKTQFELLKFASTLVNKGGKICYSTCSILKEENTGIVQKFLSGNSEFSHEKETLKVPHVDNFDCDGGYCAILTKK